MPSTTLLLAVLLSIMSFFQGIVALPASSSTSSLVSESTNSLGAPLDSGSETTTALGGLPQATPTAVVPMAATVNSTFEPRDFGYNPRWVGFYNNAQCSSTSHGRIGAHINLDGKYISGHAFLQSWSYNLFRPHNVRNIQMSF